MASSVKGADGRTSRCSLGARRTELTELVAMPGECESIPLSCAAPSARCRWILVCFCPLGQAKLSAALSPPILDSPRRPPHRRRLLCDLAWQDPRERTRRPTHALSPHLGP